MATHAGEKDDAAHLENRAGSTDADRIEAVHDQHRDFDDRADEAKGRNSDKYEKKYWLSVNYIGTLFAIGIAFMGGIGGTSAFSVEHRHWLILTKIPRLRFNCSSLDPDQ